MAEFQEVMREWARMLDAHRHKESIAIEALVQADAFEDAKLVEEIVMSWAAEHPEPVYPTWEQYLADLMTADMKADKTDNPNSVENYMRKTRIPADIARKLGITPKENN